MTVVHDPWSTRLARARFRLRAAWWRARFGFPRWWRRRWLRVVLAVLAVLLILAVSWATSGHPGDQPARPCTTVHGTRAIACRP